MNTGKILHDNDRASYHELSSVEHLQSAFKGIDGMGDRPENLQKFYLDRGPVHMVNVKESGRKFFFHKETNTNMNDKLNRVDPKIVRDHYGIPHPVEVNESESRIENKNTHPDAAKAHRNESVEQKARRIRKHLYEISLRNSK